MPPEEADGKTPDKEYSRLARQYKKLERDFRALSLMHEQTERLRDVNEAAKELAGFYNRLLLKNTPCIVFMLDLQLRFVLGSDKTVSFLGQRDWREMVELPFESLFATVMPEDWIEATRQKYLAVLDMGVPMYYEEKISLPGGIEAVFQISISPAGEKDGESKGVVVVMNDVSELARTREEAEQASRAKTYFLANMSHEMRTPLNAVIGMTAIAKSASELEKKDYCLGKIEEASTHLLGVINDVLDMSKIEAGKFELVPADFDFAAMLQKIITVISFRMEEKQQRFSTQVDENIPGRLHGDDQRLAQVIANLLSNAVKFTPEGGEVRLTARLLPEGTGWRPGVSGSEFKAGETCLIQVEVSDTGIGISAAQQARLFTSFAQADSGISRKFGGTGLGLVISKRIVEMMGGRIWIRSELGQGSTFAFIARLQRPLPVEEPAAAADLHERCEQCARQSKGDEDCFKNRCILLAEDVEINREIVLSLLEPTGLSIDCAENGAEALRMFAAAPDKYAMIFMDVQMPEMDGYAATRSIRALEAQGCRRAGSIPIVAMTANVFREDVEKCLAAGMNAHVGKPISLDEVLARLRDYL